MAVPDLSDESLLRLYNGLREQVKADRNDTHKFVSGEAAKKYAQSLQNEMTKRRIQHADLS